MMPDTDKDKKDKDGARGRLALLSAEESARADKIAERRGISGFSLMRAAGARAAESLLRHYPHARRVHILCGPGNNGGDGYVVAKCLMEAGRGVRIFRLGGEPKGDAARAARESEAALSFLKDDGEEIRADLIVDALFGTGLTRSMEGAAASLARRLWGSDIPVVSLDIPSGVSADTGEIMGEAFRAARTVTFFRAKAGHWLMPGRVMRGALEIADIGIPDAALDEIKPKTHLNDPDLWFSDFPFPEADAHKHKRGHALVLSGDALHTGASRLAAMAALRMGAGLVSLFGKEEALAVHANHLTSVMLERCADSVALAEMLKGDSRRNVVVLGPAASVGAETRDYVLAALGSGASVLLDADALTSFAGGAEVLFRAVGEKAAAGRGGVVVTPHEGEFSRLFPEVRGGKLERARMAAALLGGCVVLKGLDTVVVSVEGDAVVNMTGGAYLATAGSGDVLAGMVGGLLVQGMGCFGSGLCGVYLHGLLDGGIGMVAEDLVLGIPGVLRDLRDSR